MALPALLPIAARVAPAVARTLGVGPMLKGRSRRRRRRRLTASDIADLNNIKNILGKTAAANALPFYLK